MKKILLIPVFGFLAAHSQTDFNNLDSLFAYAERNSAAVKNSTQQTLLAKWTKVAAVANTVNFRDPVSFTMTDNTKLPVSFLPAEAFGGPPGTFRQITLGQQYVTNFNFNPQIDIINPYNIAKVRSASLNKELTETSNLLAKKNLFESIAATWFNIVSMQEQIRIMEKNLIASDSLVMISQNKFQQGIIRETEVNNITVNGLNVKDKLSQLKFSLEQQYNNLKILCDIPSGTKIVVSAKQEKVSFSSELKATSNLQLKNSILQAEYAKSELRANRMAVLPVLSGLFYQAWQQNSNSNFNDSKATWIQSNYIGLRLTVPFPPDANRLSQNYASKINYRVAKINADHAKIQNELSNQTLNLDYEKNYSAYVTAKQVYELKNVNYTKSLQQYKEGILSTDLMLTAFTDMLNGQINYVSSQAALEFSKYKININNLQK